MRLYVRGAIGLLTAGSLVMGAGAAQAAPQPVTKESKAAAAWLSGQVKKNLVHNDAFGFDDYGLTTDFGLALLETGNVAKARKLRNALKPNARAYTAPSATEVYAGSTAKLAVFVQRSNANPKKFGKVNLVKQVASRVSSKGATKGRISDKSAYGDYANTIGQAYAVEALSTARSGKALMARDFLLKQQCVNGSFRLNFSAADAAQQSCRTAKGAAKAPDTDATAIALQSLLRVKAPRAKDKRAIKKATSWLLRKQRTNGGFGGGVNTEAPNANSTGLAGWALIDAGRCTAAQKSAKWLKRVQVTKGIKGARGAVAYNRAALAAAKKDRITTQTRDQWRRSTAQSAVALVALDRSACKGH